MIVPDEYIERAKEEEKERLRLQQQKQYEAFEALRRYLKEGSLQLQSRKNILYMASEEEQNKWLKIQTILDPVTQKPTEFIGLHRSLTNRKSMTTADARAMMDIAKIKGWTSVKVHGSKDEKNRLWLAAKERGLEVIGFEPDDNTRKLWKQKDTQKPTGVSSAHAAPPPPPAPPAIGSLASLPPSPPLPPLSGAFAKRSKNAGHAASRPATKSVKKPVTKRGALKKSFKNSKRRKIVKRPAVIKNTVKRPYKIPKKRPKP